MSARKNRGSKKSSDKNSSANTTPGRSSPEKLTDEKRYEGYDEEQSSHNPPYQNDYDVDENDVSDRADEYKDYQDKIESNSADRSK